MGANEQTLELLRRRRSGYSLERAFYTDPDIFDQDMKALFYKEWLFAIPACEVPKSGDYVTHTIGMYRIVIVRGHDGEIRAFHNTCRHRGSVVCQHLKGSAPKLVCPYHQWTYELDGRLLWARDMGDDFKPSEHGLRPVHCRNLGGLVYVCLADVAHDIEPFAELIQSYTAPHNLNDMKIAFESTIIEDGNWKLVWENNRECYHCSGNHPDLCRTYSDEPAIAGVDGREPPEFVKEHVRRCEAAGLPSIFTMDDDGQYRLARMPLKDDAVSYTLTGRAAVVLPDSAFPLRNAGTLMQFHYPTTWNHFLADHSIVFRVTPIGPTQTEVTTKWLVPKDAEEGRDYNPQMLSYVWIATNAEDKQVVEDNQKGINSPAYTPGPYSSVQEDGVIQFTDWYCRMLERSLAPVALAAE